MTAPSSDQPIWYGVATGLGHGVHVCVLLLPSLILFGVSELGSAGWVTGIFALAITVAGVLESRFVSAETAPNDAAIRDQLAIRVATFVGLGLLGLFWSAQLEAVYLGGPGQVLQIFGGVMLAVGIGLRVAAIRTLGRRFVSDVRGGRRIHAGIYRWLRHPSEIGLLLIAVGGPLLLGAVLTAVAAALLLVPISLWRMQREEIALA